MRDLGDPLPRTIGRLLGVRCSALPLSNSAYWAVDRALGSMAPRIPIHQALTVHHRRTIK